MTDIIPEEHDAIFVTNPVNIQYLSGFTGVAPMERESFLLVTRREVRLFTYPLYRETAELLVKKSPSSVLGTPLRLTVLSKENPIQKAVSETAAKQNLKSIGYEEKNLTVYELHKLEAELRGIRLTATNDRVEQLREIKQIHELRFIRDAAKRTDECFSMLIPLLRPGVTESFVVSAIESFFRDHQAENAFSPIVAFGKNTSLPHYGLSHVSQAKLAKNDIVLIDFGAKMHGYCADMTRMVFVGSPKSEWVNAYEAVLAANTKAITMLNTGERNGATLDAAAREIIAEANLPVYPHSLGHGVGLAVHERPRLTVAQAQVLTPNMTVTIEPGVYIPGSFGIRIEDLVFINNDSITIVSQSPKELIVR